MLTGDRVADAVGLVWVTGVDRDGLLGTGQDSPGAKCMTKVRMTLCDGTITRQPASAGVTNRLIPKLALWKISVPSAAL